MIRTDNRVPSVLGNSKPARSSLLVLVSVLLTGVCVYAAQAPVRGRTRAHLAAAPAPPTPAAIQLVRQYCAGCHQGKSAPNGVVLNLDTTTAAVLKHRSVWEQVAQNVSDHHMPPPNAGQPSDAERDRIVAWIRGTFSQADCQLHDPGRVTLRRLNRAEYNNTVRDLLGVDLHPADEFPSDDVGYGFDNIGDVLSMSPLLMEKYISAAEKLMRAAVLAPEDRHGPTAHFEARRPPVRGDGTPREGDRLLTGNGELYLSYFFSKPGAYIVRVKAFGQQAGPEPARMAVKLDDKELKKVDVTATEEQPQFVEIPVTITEGPHKVSVAFLNDYYNPTDPNPKNRDRNLGVNFLEVTGPAEAMPNPLPESHRRVMIAVPGKDGDARVCARKIMAHFAARAWRRPVTPAEVARLAHYVELAQKQGESFERGVQLACEAALCSPNFLFRVEQDTSTSPGQPRRLNDYELASRLSYFLWSTMPDDTLFALAAKGALRQPAVLAAQARRMLKDPKAHALVEDFGDEWLTLRRLQEVNPDPERFPDFNDQLRDDMRQETERFFDYVMRDDRSILEFISANYTFLNERLAKHYGIPGVTGNDFRRVTLANDERGGILGMGSILTITSNPTRTSPVKRGKWVMEQLLDTSPPPPPPGTPPLKDDRGVMLTGTLRQRMEEHRKNPACASCHVVMDQIGFGLENFDATGGWRAKDGGQPIDASGILPGGKKFNGPGQLRQVLLSQKGQFTHTFIEKLMTYALGRGVERYDNCVLDRITHETERQGYRFSVPVIEIVKSDAFRMREGGGVTK